MEWPNAGKAQNIENGLNTKAILVSEIATAHKLRSSNQERAEAGSTSDRAHGDSPPAESTIGPRYVNM
jgi:hypothetical protein